MNNISRDYMMGRLQGVIKGISMRYDISEDLRKTCKQVLEDYDKWQALDQIKDTK